MKNTPNTNETIAEFFEQMADLLAIEDANPFRVRAYRQAAGELRGMTADVGEMDLRGEDLSKLRGIGEDLAEKIHEIASTGHLLALDEMHERLPASLHGLLALPGLGPKHVGELYRELGVDSLDTLRAALVGRHVRRLPGFGAKSEEKLLALLEQVGPTGDRVSLARVRPQALRLERELAAVPGVQRVVVAGSYRRARPTVGDLDILVVADDARAIEHVSTLDDVERVLGSGQTKATVILRGGLQVDVRVVPAPSFGAALHYFTGNKAHNIAVRQRARDRGLKLNEYGVFRGERRVAGDTEESVFASVGLPWIPPEMRQNRGEIEAAERGTLPRPVALDDLVTDLVRPSAAHTFEGLARASSRAGRPSLVAVWPPDEPIPGQAEREAVLIATQAPLSSRIARRPGTDLLVASLPVGAKPKTGARAIASAHPELVCFPPTFGLRGDELAGWLGVFEQLAEAGIGILAEASEELLPSLDPVLRTAKTMGVSVLLASGTSTVAGLDALELAVGQARRAWVEAADVLDTLDAQALRRLWA